VREAAARRGEHLSAAIEAGKRAYREEKDRPEGGALEPGGGEGAGAIGTG
jgi:hypothetical protein